MSTAARRRTELDQSYLTHYATPESTGSAGFSIAYDVLRSKAEAFSLDWSGYDEGHFASLGSNIARCSPVVIPDLMRGLMWRGRHQSKVFQVFMQLCLHQFCRLASLEEPVQHLFNLPDLVAHVGGALFSFEGLKPLMHPGSDYIEFDDPLVTWMHFNGPVVWLAVMIVRSATNLADVFDFIVQCGHLGRCSKEEVDRLLDACLKEKLPNPEACKDPTMANYKDGVNGSPFFGMFLPSGAGASLASPDDLFTSTYHAFYSRLTKIEEAYDALFDVPEHDRLSIRFQQDKKKDARELTPYPIPPNP
ncbi:uncharacterized protein KY384_003494 [Bacidia gigantensis]|uniref:uncharacterized protein n=1 Tax=Bacidia gigantensis TaxID=2732470 RepID=UPI001D05281E|nr:uncharacterized protein KY384_003494 [Bacidia gigantensis]KAG8531858.1 hypothetical protein KY384_003494 [Bacidia gigantensis]